MIIQIALGISLGAFLICAVIFLILFIVNYYENREYIPTSPVKNEELPKPKKPLTKIGWAVQEICFLGFWFLGVAIFGGFLVGGLELINRF